MQTSNFSNLNEFLNGWNSNDKYFEMLGLMASLSKLFSENDVPYFAEARLTLICKKLYAKELSEDGFIEKKYVDTFYSDKDWHVMYIAEIEKVLVE